MKDVMHPASAAWLAEKIKIDAECVKDGVVNMTDAARLWQQTAMVLFAERQERDDQIAAMTTSPSNGFDTHAEFDVCGIAFLVFFNRADALDECMSDWSIYVKGTGTDIAHALALTDTISKAAESAAYSKASKLGRPSAFTGTDTERISAWGLDLVLETELVEGGYVRAARSFDEDEPPRHMVKNVRAVRAVSATGAVDLTQLAEEFGIADELVERINPEGVF